MMRFAEIAAPFFDTAEIIELHHDAQGRRAVGHGADDRRADGRGVAGLGARPDARTRSSPGARGGAGPAGIRVHSVRMRGMVAHQEVILGALGQTLTIRQDSYDRASFMPGVLLACKRVGRAPASPSASGRCSTSDRPDRPGTAVCPQAGTRRPHETHRLRGLSIHRLDPS